ncbi:MAG: AAA family ATPase [Planctomycetes bacterium]|nr:AAA family ATPase [Planctomycetota bacterium]
MRLIIVGCEYVGQTTLAKNLQEWAMKNGIHFHMDDHFTIPDAQNLSADERERMSNLGPVVKERFQRFQIYYHIKVLQENEHCLLTGFHIEESVYGPKYYYGHPVPMDYPRRIEPELPEDCILVHLTARKEVIARRMKESPHPHGVVKEADIEEVSRRFAEEVGKSWLRRRVTIDTSDLTPGQVMERCLSLVVPHLSEKDLLRMALRKLG